MNSHFSYQSTNQNWIGDIPSHWSIKRLKYLTHVRKELSEHGTEELLSVTETRGIVKRKELRNVEENISRSENLNGYRLVRKGDLVNNIMLVWKRGLGVSKYDGIVSPAYSVFSFNGDCDPNFFNYLLRSDEYITEFRRNSTGIIMSRLRLYDDSFGNVFAHLPPIEEQNLISRYLDKKTSQIDSLVEKIQKKVDFLNEQQTSLINHYVTKGLNSNVEMKDSGVEWIGEIPKHWKISKFGFVASLETGNTPSKSQEDLYFSEDQNGFLWVKPSDLDVGFQGVSNSEVKLTFEGKEQSRVIPKDSILVCCIGNTSGKFSIANCDLSTNQQINSITFKNQILPRYGLYYMDVFGRDLLKWMNFVTLPIISKGDLSQQPVIIPPKSEQIEISEILDKIISEQKGVVELHLQKIQLLKEYRQSLISSVVTGKVRIIEDMI